VSTLIRLTDRGLYCEAGDFHVDPWEPVDHAVVTHAHGDHVAWGCRRYVTSAPGHGVLRTRIGPGAPIDALPYGETVVRRGVRVSLHPAGHILGSAQVRIEHGGEVWVVSGDYKTEPDRTCAAFEPVRCHTFISESTFGLPIYRWTPEDEVYAEINAWWRGNADQGRPCFLYGYALGKAQRLLAGLDPSIGPILVHGAVEKLNAAYRVEGVPLPPTGPARLAERPDDWPRAMIVAPPSAHGSTWMRRFGPSSSAFASGWMRVRGARRRRAVDRGFVLSDHADWPGLLAAIAATGAERVWVTHGFTAVVVRWLREQGLDAQTIRTRFEGENEEAAEQPAEAETEPAEPEETEP
jgi:putative mRNA 3-end processing factor